MTIISTTVGRNPLRRNGVAIIVNKESPKCTTWMQSQKWQIDLCSFPRQTISITVIQVCAPTSNAEDAEVEWYYEDLQNLLELTPKKDVLFIIGYWNVKVGSQVTLGNNRQIWPWSTEWSRAKTNKRVLPRECTGHSKHHIPRPNLPVTPGVSWLPTFASQSPIMKRTSFLGVSSRRSCRSSQNHSTSAS